MPDETLQQATGALNSNGKWIKREMNDIEENVMGPAQKAYDGIVKGATDFMGQIKTGRYMGFVRQYPVQTAVGALVIGALLGLTLSRKGE